LAETVPPEPRRTRAARRARRRRRRAGETDVGSRSVAASAGTRGMSGPGRNATPVTNVAGRSQRPSSNQCPLVSAGIGASARAWSGRTRAWSGRRLSRALMRKRATAPPAHSAMRELCPPGAARYERRRARYVRTAARGTCRRRSSRVSRCAPARHGPRAGARRDAAGIRRSVFAGTATAGRLARRAARVLWFRGHSSPRPRKPGFLVVFVPRTAQRVPEPGSASHRDQPGRRPLNGALAAARRRPDLRLRSRAGGGSTWPGAGPPRCSRRCRALAVAAAGDRRSWSTSGPRDAAAAPRETPGGRHLRPVARPALRRRSRRVLQTREPGVRNAPSATSRRASVAPVPGVRPCGNDRERTAKRSAR